MNSQLQTTGCRHLGWLSFKQEGNGSYNGSEFEI